MTVVFFVLYVFFRSCQCLKHTTYFNFFECPSSFTLLVVEHNFIGGRTLLFSTRQKLQKKTVPDSVQCLQSVSWMNPIIFLFAKMPNLNMLFQFIASDNRVNYYVLVGTHFIVLDWRMNIPTLDPLTNLCTQG